MKVSAATSSSRSPATTVSVEVQPDVVRDDVGGAEVKQVTAGIPVSERGRVRWTEERLPKISEQPAGTGGPAKHTYATTHYGRSEAHQLGVRVKLETDRGDVVARPGGEAQRVREGDKPPPGGDDEE